MAPLYEDRSCPASGEGMSYEFLAPDQIAGPSSLLRSSYALDLFSHSARKHQPDHLIIGQERPDGVPECRGPVSLDKEMAGPGGSVSGDEGEREKPPPAVRKKRGGAGEYRNRTGRMQRTCGGPAMLGDVVRPELGEGFHVTLCHDAPPDI